MKFHKLKTDPQLFDCVLNDCKTVEIRFNDRGYEVGDYLLLRRTQWTGRQMKDGAALVYTGTHILAKISHVQSEIGLLEGWLALSIKILDTGNEYRTE